MEKVGNTVSKHLRMQVIIALCFGGLYAFALNCAGYGYQDFLYAGSFLFIELVLGARMMTTIFRYFQPKKTFSFVPLTTLLLATTILTSFFYFVISKLPIEWQPKLYQPNFWSHVVLVFFTLWILFYEWWFLKNDQRNSNDMKRLLHLQENLKNAEIKNIQQNVQPHFLFNSLNSISSLTISSPEEAQKMVVKLSEFLRHSVMKNQKMFSSLKDELEQIERYLGIEQIRFSNRLVFELKHKDENNHLEIPSMLLQPLIENAIKYGLYGQIGKVKITMTCERIKGYLVVTITNPVDEEHTVKKGTGFGFSSIRQKLYLLFAENNLLTTELKNQIFQTELKIPIRDESNSN